MKLGISDRMYCTETMVGLLPKETLLDLAWGPDTRDDVRAAVLTTMGWALETSEAAEVLYELMLEHESDEVRLGAVRGAAGHLHDRAIWDGLQVIADCEPETEVGQAASMILGNDETGPLAVLEELSGCVPELDDIGVEAVYASTTVPWQCRLHIVVHRNALTATALLAEIVERFPAASMVVVASHGRRPLIGPAGYRRIWMGLRKTEQDEPTEPDLWKRAG